MPRHSFIRMTKLSNVVGRVDYISNPKRQEHLYAAYSTVTSEFWQRLSQQSQYDFQRSNQKSGKCVEAGELVIALPENLQQADPKILLQFFTEKFREMYGMQCAAALHHNKSKTNYHIHLVFAERDLLEKAEVKRATRNMFYNEEGRHVRTKKEILDEDGNVRKGCRIIAKGDIYDIKWFGPRKDIFKSKKFLREVKEKYTELINLCLGDEKEKLTVFQPDGPYLATKKIGKNNPMEAEIKADNAASKEWNDAIDSAMINGMSVERAIETKQAAISYKIAQDIAMEGYRPDRFRKIVQEGVRLVEFLITSIKEFREKGFFAWMDMPPEQIADDLGIPMPERPSSSLEELQYMKMEQLTEKLRKADKRIYAITARKKELEKELKNTTGLLQGKRRKELQAEIDAKAAELAKAKTSRNAMPKMYGYESVADIKREYEAAANALDEVYAKQDIWDQGQADYKLRERRKIEQEIEIKQDKSIRSRLQEKKNEVENRDVQKKGKRKFKGIEI